MALQSTIAYSQDKPIETSISSTVLGTSNGASSAKGLEQRDLYLLVQPQLSYSRVGSGLRVRADVGVELFATRNGTRDNRALPTVLAKADATLVDQFFFVASDLDVHQVERDPFAARVASGVTENAITQGTLTVSPVVSRELTPDLSFLARTDRSLVRSSGDAGTNLRLSRTTVRLAFKPRPVGGLGEIVSQRSVAPSSQGSDWGIDFARGGPSFALNNELVGAVSVGVERTTSSIAVENDSIYGFNVLWLPSQRTDFSASVDHRFFGTGFNVSIRHRTPFFALSLRAVREPIFAAASNIGSESNLATFLDSILTTRNPDPVERAKQVGDIIGTRGLQTELSGVAGFAGDYAQLGSGGEATVLFLGTRNALAISVYRQTISPLVRADGVPLFVGTGAGDNRQTGVIVGLNRRLTPDTSLDVSIRSSRIEGLSLRLGDVSLEKTYRAAIGRNVTARTLFSLGAQFRQYETNVIGLVNFDETTAFMTITHRF